MLIPQNEKSKILFNTLTGHCIEIENEVAEGKGVAFYLDWGIPPISTAIEQREES